MQLDVSTGWHNYWHSNADSV